MSIRVRRKAFLAIKLLAYLRGLHCQEHIQLFDIHNCLFLRLHFTIGGYDYRGTTRLRQSIHFSFTQVLFADHVHRRTGVHNKLSFLRFQGLMAQVDTNFPKVRRMLFLCFSLKFSDIFGQLPRCFTGTLLLPLCLFLRPILKFWTRGATLMRITWANHSKRWILVSNVSMTDHGFSESNTSDWFQYVWALPQKSVKTSAAPYLEIRNPIAV